MNTVVLLVALLGAGEQGADNPFVQTGREPLVSLARPAEMTSYAGVVASLGENKLPPPAAVRIEELLEHFTYDEPTALGSHPISATVEIFEAPWHPQHRLVWIRVAGKAQESRDVRAQIEFNPARVAEYRVIGYEDQISSAYDHRPESRVDRGTGFSVLLEIVSAGGGVDVTTAGARCWPSLKLIDSAQVPSKPDPALACSMLALKVRYRIPGQTETRLIELFATDHGEKYSDASRDFRFGAAVAEFGMILRDSPYKGTSSFEWVIKEASSGIESDRDVLRTGFIRLVEHAKRIAEDK